MNPFILIWAGFGAVVIGALFTALSAVATVKRAKAQSDTVNQNFNNLQKEAVAIRAEATEAKEETKKTKTIADSIQQELKDRTDELIKTKDELSNLIKKQSMEDRVEAEFQLFRSGIATEYSFVDREIREWYDWAKEFNVKVPPPSPHVKIELLGTTHGYTPIFEPRGPGQIESVTVDYASRSMKVWAVSYPNVAVWRGLSNLLLGRQILNAELGYSEFMMCQEFDRHKYLNGSPAQKRQYMHAMFFSDPN